MLCHPGKLRPLTVGEYARLQQFPSDWQFAGSTRQKYIQIGNAVPTGLGLAIGKALLETARLTLKHGLPADLKKLRGKVVCADSNLAARIKNRPKTQLNPPRLEKIQTRELHLRGCKRGLPEQHSKIMPKTISIKGLTPVKQRFHNEPINVYHTTVDFEGIEFWKENARTLLAFRQFEQQRNKTTAKGKPVTLEEVTRFLAADPDLKLEALAKSIAGNGVRVPLIVTTHGTLLDGNRRYFACSLLKLQAEDEKSEMPSVLKSIPVWAIEDSDIDERKKKKILAEVNFLDDLKVKWPLSVQAKLITEFFSQCMKAKKTADQAYDEIYDLYGVRSDKAKSYVEAEKLADEFIDLAKNPEHRLQLEEAVQKRFLYFWEFVNKSSGWLRQTHVNRVAKS